MPRQLLRSRLAAALLLAGLLAAPGAHARDASQASGHASGLLSQGTSTVVAGSAEALADGASLTVEAVEASGDALLLTLHDAARAAGVVVRVGGLAAGGLSVAAGTTVEVLADASGTALRNSGRVIGYVPNAVGKSLLYHARLEAHCL